MGERKNIDRLFQEQLKNFEQSPDDHVWENIRKELEDNKEPKKKALPIWYRFGGIAASFILFIGLAVVVWSDDSAEINTTIVNTDERDKKETIKKEPKFNQVGNEPKKDVNFQDVIAFEKNKNDETIKQPQENNRDVPFNTVIKPQTNSYVRNSNSVQQEGQLFNNDIEKPRFDSNEKSLIPKEVIVKGNHKDIDEVLKTDSKNIVTANMVSQSNKEGNTRKDVILSNVVKEDLENNQLNPLVASKKENSFVKNSVNSSGKTTDKYRKEGVNEAVVTNEDSGDRAIISKEDKLINKVPTKEKSLEVSIVENTVINKEALEDSFKDKKTEGKIAENNTLNTVGETSSTKEEKVGSESEKEEEDKTKNEEKLPAIEEAIALQEKNGEDAEEEKDKEEGLQNKWQINPNIAPVYYNSLSSGSPIDDQFKGNKKKGKINMSYGLNVSYKLNKKLKVRTGVNKLELGYNTENVAVVPAAEGASIDYIKNVTMSSGASQLNISSADGFSVSQIPSSFQNLFDASISQKFGYIEVPLELSYQVSSKKVSIDLIAGMSTFFLNKNEVHAQTNSFTTYLGEANNLNKMSFSTNFGVGFNYKISKAFNLNVEPTFKYQLNSFSSDSGSFKPYILGVYSGLSFKF